MIRRWVVAVGWAGVAILAGGCGFQLMGMKPATQPDSAAGPAADTQPDLAGAVAPGSGQTQPDGEAIALTRPDVEAIALTRPDGEAIALTRPNVEAIALTRPDGEAIAATRPEVDPEASDSRLGPLTWAKPPEKATVPTPETERGAKVAVRPAPPARDDFGRDIPPPAPGGTDSPGQVIRPPGSQPDQPAPLGAAGAAGPRDRSRVVGESGFPVGPPPAAPDVKVEFTMPGRGAAPSAGGEKLRRLAGQQAAIIVAIYNVTKELNEQSYTDPVENGVVNSDHFRYKGGLEVKSQTAVIGGRVTRFDIWLIVPASGVGVGEGSPLAGEPPAQPKFEVHVRNFALDGPPLDADQIDRLLRASGGFLVITQLVGPDAKGLYSAEAALVRKAK